MATRSKQSTPAALLDLARTRFGNLTAAESLLLRSVTEGRIAFCGGTPAPDLPAHTPLHAADRFLHNRVRTDVIRWICASPEARGFVDPFGIQIDGAFIAGDQTLDLSSVVLPFPLVFLRCTVTTKIMMLGMEVPFLSFEGSHVGAMEADVLRIKGDLYLCNGFRSQGGLKLPGATIGGDFDCTGAHFLHSSTGRGDKIVLHANGITVGGDVLLRDGCSVHGKVALVGATIAGDVDCSGSRFESPSDAHDPEPEPVFNADRATINGDLMLGKGFHAVGEVRLLSAHIESNLDCDGGTFANPTAIALAGDGARVDGSVLFRDNFTALGQIRLIAAHIGQQLACERATFRGELTVNSATIDGTLLWREIREPSNVTLDLRNTSVGAFVNEHPSWPSSGRLQIEGFVYGRMSKGQGDEPDWLEWVRLQPADATLPQPFRQLAKFLQQNGSDYGARRVLYHMEHDRRRRERRNLKGLRYYRARGAGILSQMVGFGFFPSWALWWLLALAVAGTGVFWGGYLAGNMAPTDKEAYALFTKGGRLPPHYEPFHASIYSLENSFPAVKLGQADRWQPDPGPQRSIAASESCGLRLLNLVLSPHRLSVFRWVQICLGWFLASMFVAAVSGIVRKD